MNRHPKQLLTKLAPVLGAGAVGACPICWLGSASLLTYLGLGALIPVWQGVVVVLLVISVIGFLLDYRSHRNFRPLALLVVGGGLLYIGRYLVGGAGFGGWPVWGPGAILVLMAVLYNKRQFAKTGSHAHRH